MRALMCCLAISLWTGAGLADSDIACKGGVDPTEAEAACTAWIEGGALDGATLSDALSNRAFWRLTLGEWDDAAADLSRAIELSPDNAEAYYHLGLLSQAQGEDAAAVANFDRALELEPNWVNVLVDRGNVLHRQGDFAAAIDDYVAALGQGPEDSVIYGNMAGSFRRLGHDEMALAALNRALELEPFDDGALIQRGETLERLGRYEAAVADYGAALDLDYDFWAPKMKVQMQAAEMWGGPLDGPDSPEFRAALRDCVISPDC